MLAGHEVRLLEVELNAQDLGEDPHGAARGRTGQIIQINRHFVG